ncbi:MAG: carboxypeptidase-like regulatory domain-containing protein, partial [Bacteroidetes bacterium]|nr:carboxypeptidase-like regulatory domain-containing protein [Bacteroidota bacterium]
MSKTHRLLVLLGVFLLAGIAPRLAAQPVSSVTLSGTVVEAETGQPLEGANVFLANTLIGTTTDQNGFFSMTGVTLGTHELVASFVGFQAQTERLRLIQAGDLTVDFRLALRVVESDGIEVTATSPKRWQRQYKTFEKFFLGISRNASKCEILNPEVLDFEVDEATGEFIARARSPLLIENRALGYLLRFVLEGFQLNEKKRLIRYRGRVGFTEIRPRSDREAQRWAKRRLEAYNGSLRHFLASLVRDEVAGEGFMVVSEEDSREAAYSGVPGARPSARITTVRPENILGPGELDFERKLDFIGYLKILYFKEIPSSAYLKYREYANRGLRASEDEQVSWISLNHPGVLFTTDGIVEDTYALTKFGYWYFERVAELLPYEYRPPGFMDVREALPPPDPALVLRPAFLKGVEAVEAEAYAEAVAHLAPVVAADPGFYLDQGGSAAYWLGLAYAAREQEAAAQNTWFDGVQALRDQGRFDVRLADAYVRSVFRHEDKKAYEPAAQAYLDLLEQADTMLSEEEHEIVLSHVAQMLPVLTDEERLRVMGKKDVGPLLQRLELQPGAGSFLATLWRTQDPLPASALNERVAEHLARVAYSLNNYAFSAARTGFDDRGKAYVQYGP